MPEMAPASAYAVAWGIAELVFRKGYLIDWFGQDSLTLQCYLPTRLPLSPKPIRKVVQIVFKIYIGNKQASK